MKNAFFILLTVCFLMSCEQVEPENTTPESPEKWNIVRKNQRTIRYNCKGSVTSDKVETVNTLRKGYRIKAPRRKNLWSFVATAEQSGDSNRGTWGRYGTFTVDIAPTLLNIQVYPGLNEIRYQFGYCSEVSRNSETGEETCVVPVTYTEEKSFWLEVDYRVQMLEGVRTIKPSVEECDQKS